MNEQKKDGAESALSLRSAMTEMLKDKEGVDDLFRILADCVWLEKSKN